MTSGAHLVSLSGISGTVDILVGISVRGADITLNGWSSFPAGDDLGHLG